MKKITTQMPSIIYGTAWKKERTEDLVIQAVKCGFRGIDTACQPKHYNEAGVGQALSKLLKAGMTREELYIQTKFTPAQGQDPFTIPYDKTAPVSEQVAQSFMVSKKNLGVSYVDGLILHSPLESIEQTKMAWKGMERIHAEGEAKLLGLSNCYDLETLEELYTQALVKPTILQNRFYQDTDYDHAIRLFCLEKGIVYQGFWTLTANPQILSHESVQKAAKTYRKTAAQIFFRVLVELKIVPLTGTCSLAHMKEDLEIEHLDLPANVIQEVASQFTRKEGLHHFL